MFESSFNSDPGLRNVKRSICDSFNGLPAYSLLILRTPGRFNSLSAVAGYTL